MRIFFAFFILSVCLMPTTALPREPLRVVTLHAPPMVIDNGETFSGLALEMAVAGLKRAGYEAKIVLAPWKRAVYMARHGDADALFFAAYNEERAAFFHYPEIPLVSLDLVLVKRVGTEAVVTPDRKGLSHLVLGVGRGFAYGPKIDAFIREAGFRLVEATVSNELNFAKLLDGRIGLLLADRALARHLMEKPGNKGLAEYVKDEQGNVAVLETHKAYLVFSKATRSADDAARFSKALEAMKADGAYRAIVEKYQ